jgi:hypothetical protein
MEKAGIYILPGVAKSVAKPEINRNFWCFNTARAIHTEPVRTNSRIPDFDRTTTIVEKKLPGKTGALNFHPYLRYFFPVLVPVR